MEEFLDTKDVCRLLKVKESTVRKWVSQKKIPAVRIGKLVRFRMKDIDGWIKERLRVG